MRGVNLTLCRFVNVHLFNLLTGLPHEAPLRKVLPLNWGHQGDCLVVAKQINSSRIALVVKSISDVVGVRKSLVAWDWRTGEVVSIFFLLWESGLHPTSPRCLNARVMTQKLAMRSP